MIKEDNINEKKTCKIEDKKDVSAKNWRIISVINFPLGGFPESSQSRVPSKSIKSFNGMSITIRPWKGDTIPFPIGYEQATLVIDTIADSAEDAVDKVEYVLEMIIDNLSFQLQTYIRIFQLEVIDSSEPFIEGCTRDVLLYPPPLGYPFAKSLSVHSLGNIRTSTIPTFDDIILNIGKRTREALRWYVKGLSSACIIDKFIYFWICLEILSKDKKIKEPYKGPCGHEIPNCPKKGCGISTIREVRGMTQKKFLTDTLSVDEIVTEKLWKMRQMIHGEEIDLENKHILLSRDLPKLTLALMSAVLLGLKMKLNIIPDRNPIITLDNYISIAGVGCLCVKRVINKQDIE